MNLRIYCRQEGLLVELELFLRMHYKTILCLALNHCLRWELLTLIHTKIAHFNTGIVTIRLYMDNTLQTLKYFISQTNKWFIPCICLNKIQVKLIIGELIHCNFSLCFTSNGVIPMVKNMILI